MRLLLAILALVVALPATAAVPVQFSGNVNPSAHIAGLTRTDRDPRPWFVHFKGVPIPVAKLVPGKPTHWYYEWVLEDGTTVTKIATAPIKGMPDRRAFRDAHPDLAIFIPCFQIMSGAAGNYMGNKL